MHLNDTNVTYNYTEKEKELLDECFGIKLCDYDSSVLVKTYLDEWYIDSTSNKYRLYRDMLQLLTTKIDLNKLQENLILDKNKTSYFQNKSFEQCALLAFKDLILRIQNIIKNNF